jgi:Rap1a immunity proteins
VRLSLAFTVAALGVVAGDMARAQTSTGPAPAGGVSAPPGFDRGSVAHLAALCSATPENPQRGEALGLCYGFLIGVGQYHGALHPPGSPRPPLFCLPDPPPTLQDTAAMFVTWSRANPQNAAERAVDGVFRWTRSQFPCPAGSPAPADRRRPR